MVNSIKLFKNVGTLKNRCYRIGGSDSNWSGDGHIVYIIPGHRPFVEIKTGDVVDRHGEEVPALDIAKAILRDNRSVRAVNSNGPYKKEYYEKYWFFDYEPELKEFFEKNKLPLPADGKSIGQRMKEKQLMDLKMQGLITDADLPQNNGQAALEEAKKLKEHEEQMNAMKKELEDLKKANEDLAKQAKDLSVAKETIEAEEPKSNLEVKERGKKKADK